MLHRRPVSVCDRMWFSCSTSFRFLDIVCKLHINYALSRNCRRIFLSIWASDFCFFDQHISLSEFQSSFCSKRVHGGGRGSGDHNAQEFLEEVQQQFSCSANVFFLLSSPAYVSSPSLASALSRSLSLARSLAFSPPTVVIAYKTQDR